LVVFKIKKLPLRSVFEKGLKKLLKMHSDPIADYLTRLRNAIMANHRVVEMPVSKMRTNISKVLLDKGYIHDFKVESTDSPVDSLKIALKYNPVSKKNAIEKLERASKPGLRKYSSADELPRVLNGLGIAVLSTSKGVMSDKEARAQHIGGEVLCYVY